MWCWVQIKTDNMWKTFKTNKELGIFLYQTYSLFAFLAGIRNYDCCEPLAPLKWLPFDLNDPNISEEAVEGCKTYFTVSELLSFDYDKVFENRRPHPQHNKEDIIKIDGYMEVLKPGKGRMVSYRENLGEHFFTSLAILQGLGDPQNVRIIICFDY